MSVVIPAFDAERYLGDAIESVLDQTHPPAEVIVVDDGSSDGTSLVARRYRAAVRCVRQSRSGIGAAVNLGIALSCGEQLAFLDADDLWTEGKLALQIDALERSPQLDMVFGLVGQFRSTDLGDEQQPSLEIRHDPVPGICRGTMLIRREALVRVGPFATRWKLGEFVDWYARALDASLTTLVLPEVVMYRRLHTANSGIRDREAQSEYVEILRAVLDRRRSEAT